MPEGLPQDDPKLGTVLNGTYRLESILGTGGMGTVYLARHVATGGEFAIKSLVQQFISNAEALKRFQREAQICKQMGHPNIVKVHDFDYDAAGTPFMVMDLLRGETLRERLERMGRLKLGQILPIARQLAAGLDAAHGHGVVHRDLKPENLFLCEGSDLLKILDFGVSKVSKFNTQLTRPMAMLGTPYYMSPEQAMGNTADVDRLSDVWAVGAILFEALTGRGAFLADNPVAVFYKIVNEPFPLASANGADVTRAVDRVLLRACSKAPEERFQCMADLVRELEAAANATDETRPLAMPDTPRTDVPALPTQITGGKAPLGGVATQILGAGAPLAGQATKLINAPPGDDEKTGRSVMPEHMPKPVVSSEAPTALTALPDQATATVPLPPQRAAPKGALERARAKTDPPIARARDAVRATRQSLPTLGPLARLSRWQLGAIAGGLALAVAAAVGIAVVHQRHREERDAHDAIADAIGEQRWEDAAQALSAYAARFGEPPDAPEIRDRVSMGKQAHNALSRARGLREAEDFRGAAAALSAIDPRTGYGTAVQEERGRLASDVRLAIERAVRERRCADAARLASALRAADPRSPAPPSCDDGRREAADARTNASDAQHAYAHRDFAHALESAQAALRDDPGLDAAWRIAGISACMTGNGEEAHRARPHLDRELQRSLDKLCHAHHVSGFGPSEAHESPSSPQPPAEPAMMRAREQIQRMLGTAEPFARKCFAKVPSYHPTMKVRVTAFPGSDHYVATAISTGPVEIRTCLEALFKPLHPPRVTAAISAERLYGSASDEE